MSMSSNNVELIVVNDFKITLDFPLSIFLGMTLDLPQPISLEITLDIFDVVNVF